MLGAFDLCQCLVGDTMDGSSSAHGLAMLNTDIIPLIAIGLLHSRLSLRADVSIANKEHFFILVRSDEISQVKQDSLLTAGRTDDFIFGLDGGGMVQSEERLRA